MLHSVTALGGRVTVASYSLGRFYTLCYETSSSAGIYKPATKTEITLA